MHDATIRPYGGDLLVVILIYCFLKSFLDLPVRQTAVGVLGFAYAVELSQYFHLISLLGWQKSKAARLILSTSFAWTDLLMYTMGILVVFFAENKKRLVPAVKTVS
jgi:DNA integrity scanning protein DisA with diadenylate cyclase activity